MFHDTIAGCGVIARVDETDEPGTVEVWFPEIPGIPPAFEEIDKIISDIIPAHLLIRYRFWFITWEQLEQRLPTWQDIEEKHLTWEQLQSYVEPGPFSAALRTPSVVLKWGSKLISEGRRTPWILP